MRNVKILIKILIILSFGAFHLNAQSGIEISGYVTGGGNISFPTEAIRDNIEIVTGVSPLGFITGESGINIAGGVQIGYFLSLTSPFSGFSLLADVGIAYSTYSSRSIITNLVLDTDIAIVNFTPKVLTFVTGGIVKFNFLNSFSMGFGGGIKTILGSVTADIVEETADLSTNITTTATLVNQYSFIPYGKINFEYTSYIRSDLVFRAGIGLEGEFTPLIAEVENPFLPLSINANVIFGVSYLLRFYQR